MGALVSLSTLFEGQHVWRGRAAPAHTSAQPTGWAALDAVLPASGWPDASLSEILFPIDGAGELSLVLPTVVRLSQGARPIVLVAPPYQPCVAGWRQQGVDMRRVHIVASADNDALWATEQCLRSGSCAAVLTWPRHADDRALRRLQVAADTGRALALAFRDRRHRDQPSPAALRLELDPHPQTQVWVRKCRGGAITGHAIVLPPPSR